MSRISAETKENIMPHEKHGKVWELLGTVLLTISKSNFLCVIDNHITFSKVEQAEKH